MTRRKSRSGTPTVPNAARKNKMHTITLPPDAEEVLEDMIRVHGGKSQAIAYLLLHARR